MALDMVRLHVGDEFVVMFRLRKEGTRDPQPVDPVSGAATLVVEQPDGTFLAALAADSGHPDADWLHGHVPVQVGGSDVTAAVGTYHAYLRVQDGGEDYRLPHEGHVVFEIGD